MDIQGRIGKLRKKLEQASLDAILITNPINRRYISGFSGSSGYVVVTPSRAVLFTDFRYRTQAPQQAVHYEIVEHGAKPMDAVRELLNEIRAGKIGFEQNHVTYGTYQSLRTSFDGIELAGTDGWIEELRMVKDEAELAIMREAADLADRTFHYIIGRIKPGVSERQIALELEFFMREHGADGPSFDTIVASGERSALPHGVASDRMIGNNEFVKLDFGAYYKGYCSDITRTVVVGKPSDKHREIYGIVLEAQLAGLAGIKPGMTGMEADGLTRDIIRRYGYSDYFGHGTGHGLGMEIHEEPRLSLTGAVVLRPGMTVTVEPGIYLPDFGGVRIEDDVVVTENGVERLTQSSKDLVAID